MTSDNAIFQDKIFIIQYKLIFKYFSFLVVKNKDVIIIIVLNFLTCITLLQKFLSNRFY